MNPARLRYAYADLGAGSRNLAISCDLAGSLDAEIIYCVGASNVSEVVVQNPGRFALFTNFSLKTPVVVQEQSVWGRIRAHLGVPLAVAIGAAPPPSALDNDPLYGGIRRFLHDLLRRHPDLHIHVITRAAPDVVTDEEVLSLNLDGRITVKRVQDFGEPTDYARFINYVHQQLEATYGQAVRRFPRNSCKTGIEWRWANNASAAAKQVADGLVKQGAESGAISKPWVRAVHGYGNHKETALPPAEARQLHSAFTALMASASAPLQNIQDAAARVAAQSAPSANLDNIVAQTDRLQHLLGEYALINERVFSPRQSAGPSLLLLNDEQMFLGMMGVVLTVVFPGLGVRGALSGDEALALAAESPPDLLICDLQRPGEDGCAFVKKFRATHPETLIMICSGFSFPLVAAELSPVVNAIVELPVTSWELTQTVRSLLQLAGFTQLNCATPPTP